MFGSGRTIKRAKQQQQQFVIHRQLKFNITNFGQWLRNFIPWRSHATTFVFLCRGRRKGRFMDAVHYRRCMVCFQFIAHRPPRSLSPHFHHPLKPYITFIHLIFFFTIIIHTNQLSLEGGQTHQFPYVDYVFWMLGVVGEFCRVKSINYEQDSMEYILVIYLISDLSMFTSIRRTAIYTDSFPFFSIL